MRSSAPPKNCCHSGAAPPRSCKTCEAVSRTAVTWVLLSLGTTCRRGLVSWPLCRCVPPVHGVCRRLYPASVTRGGGCLGARGNFVDVDFVLLLWQVDRGVAKPHGRWALQPRLAQDRSRSHVVVVYTYTPAQSIFLSMQA